MLRLFVVRTFRALLAVWFVLSIGEPSVVHICPMHASASAELADLGGGGSSRPMDMGEHAYHAGHHAGHGSHSSGEHGHHCTCINCCVGAAASALLPPPHAQVVSSPVLAVVSQLPPSSDRLVLESPPHLLPPGTGPPRA